MVLHSRDHVSHLPLKTAVLHLSAAQPGVAAHPVLALDQGLAPDIPNAHRRTRGHTCEHRHRQAWPDEAILGTTVSRGR